MYAQIQPEVNEGVGPPHNIEAEQALLGAILVNNIALDRVSEFMKPEFFFDPLHAEIYDVMFRLIQAGKIATPVTLRTFFENSEPINVNLSVPQYLGRLAVRATTVINAASYGRTIRDLALKRTLISVGHDIVNDAFGADVDATPEDMIVAAEVRLAGVAEGKLDKRICSIKDAAEDALERFNAAYKRDNGLSGISTGFCDVDSKTGGLQPSDLIILAGRPSMGKTALVTNIARNVAQNGFIDDDGVEQEGRVLFNSLEMSKDQLAGRMIASEAGVSSSDLRKGKANEFQMRKVIKATETISKLPIDIDDEGGLTIAKLSARARRHKRKHGLALLIVDYLQLLVGSKGVGGNRVQEITEITVGLKALAKELGIPVIALSQLSRQVENREDKRPQLSDLRESGSIEQDADVVFFVFREEYYVERTKPSDTTDHSAMQAWNSRMSDVAGKAELIAAKQRHGPLGTIPLQFEGRFTQFSNAAQQGGAKL